MEVEVSLVGSVSTVGSFLLPIRAKFVTNAADRARKVAGFVTPGRKWNAQNVAEEESYSDTKN